MQWSNSIKIEISMHSKVHTADVQICMLNEKCSVTTLPSVSSNETMIMLLPVEEDIHPVVTPWPQMKEDVLHSQTTVYTQ